MQWVIRAFIKARHVMSTQHPKDKNGQPTPFRRETNARSGCQSQLGPSVLELRTDGSADEKVEVVGLDVVCDGLCGDESQGKEQTVGTSLG